MFQSLFYRSYVYVLDGRFATAYRDPTYGKWTHLVLNYLGPTAGIATYIDGVQEDQDDKVTQSNLPGPGRVNIGKKYLDEIITSGNLDMDELFFFNTKLCDAQVIRLQG